MVIKSLLNKCRALTEFKIKLSATEIENLSARGFELLRGYDYAGAVKVGKQLEQLRYSSCFEILALAYAGMDKRETAITTLERGVKRAPNVWLLWQLLGNYYSDEKSFDRAYHAYARALKCDHADASSIHLNWAIALSRKEDYQAALDLLEKVVDPAIHRRRIDITLSILNSLACFEEASVLAMEILNDEPSEDCQLESRIHAHYALAIWKGSANREMALEESWQAIALDKTNERAMCLIREIENSRSDKAILYHLLVEGRLNDPVNSEEAPQGFFSTYQVVADDLDEALELASRFEPEDIRSTLRISESKVLKHQTDEPKGVYFCSGYCLFPIEEA